MLQLGAIYIRDEISIVHCRNKIRTLSLDLNFSSVEATRLATATSEICWLLLPNEEQSSVNVSFDKINERFGLLLVFQGATSQFKASNFEFLFDQFDIVFDNNGIQDIRAFKFFRNPTFIPSDGFIETAKSKLLELSREELMEKLKEATERAESGTQAKSAFLANMSHELRTPMNAILGYAEMLAEDAEDDGNEAQLADINEISDAGKHLLSLLNDILDISKIEAGRMDLYLETFDLTKMMGEVASTTKTLVEKNKNTMEVSISEGLGELHADVTKVRQILLNLMSNSAKFTSDGTITLFGERRAKIGGDIIRLGVSDTGIGIPEDKLDHVFEEFAQADDSTTKDFGGTGLGLALVRRFCQMMGGKIWVESTMGEGSSFILELPAIVVE